MNEQTDEPIGHSSAETPLEDEVPIGQLPNTGQEGDEPSGGEMPPPKEDPRATKADPSDAAFFRNTIEEVLRLLKYFHIEGDYVGRDKYAVKGGDQFIHPTFFTLLASAPREPHDPGLPISVDFEALLDTFVSPIDCEKALQLLQEHGVLVISGASGNGRQTLAYYLMRQIETLQEIEFFQLRSAGTLLDLNDEAFAQVKANRCYLLHSSTFNRQEVLHQETLEKLATRISQKSSYLIIIWPETMMPPFKARWHYSLTSRNLPSSIAVFQKHLEWLLRDREEGAKNTLAEKLLQEQEIKEILSNVPNLRRAVYWAGFIAKLLQSSHSIEEVVDQCRQVHARWLREDARDMVVNVPSLAHLCLFISAAVLSDINVDFFKSLADRLQANLDESFGKEEMALWQQFWSGPRAHWRDVAHVQFALMSEQLQGRRVRVDVMKFDPEIMSIPVIDAFWTEYPQYRGGFLSWLQECGEHENFRVRLAAARAIGILSLRDLNVEHSVIMQWLLREDIAIQESAAMSLAIACGQSVSTAQAVVKRLEGWIEDDEVRPRLIFASSLIYAWLGMDRPQEFIRGINQLMNSRDVWVLRVQGQTATVTDTSGWRLSAVRFAFQRFLQLGDFTPEDYVSLFNRMLEWVQSSSRIRRRIGREVFVDMMLVDEALDIYSWWQSEDDVKLAWPILLRIMQRADQTSPLAAKLFSHAASSRRTWKASLAGVKRMVIFAGKEPDGRLPLKNFIYDILADDEAREVSKVLKKRLVHWAISSHNNSAKHPAPYSKQIVVWLRKRHLL